VRRKRVGPIRARHVVRRRRIRGSFWSFTFLLRARVCTLALTVNRPCRAPRRRCVFVGGRADLTIISSYVFFFFFLNSFPAMLKPGNGAQRPYYRRFLFYVPILYIYIYITDKYFLTTLN